jgi:proline dehydrogenase
MKKWLWLGWERLAQRAARSYIVGTKLEDALRACHALENERNRATLGYWDSGQESIEAVAQTYRNAILALKQENLGAYLSLKAPALGFNHSLFLDILKCAQENQVTLHFDSMAPDAADQTMVWIEDALDQGTAIGCTLPGRWRRSPGDADWAVRQGLAVRVVKGQWADPQKPDLDKRKGFMAVISRLAGRAAHVRVATHDPYLARQALSRLLETQTTCELELLYGLPRNEVLQVAKELRVGVRTYLPYGQGWLPYCISQIYENPRIIRWVLRDMVALTFRKTFLDSAAV